MLVKANPFRKELRAGWSGFKPRKRLGIFLFTTASRPVLGPTQPPTQWVAETLSPSVKRPGREADHSPPSSADVTKAWSYTSTPSIRFHSVVLSWSAGTSLSAGRRITSKNIRNRKII